MLKAYSFTKIVFHCSFFFPENFPKNFSELFLYGIPPRGKQSASVAAVADELFLSAFDRFVG